MMITDIAQIFKAFNGKLLVDPKLFLQKFHLVKAFVFDWDGVFNNGIKNEQGSSVFSEVDAMGTNLLRFNHFLRHGEIPVTAIISGERNQAAFSFARREHLHAVYYKIRNKADALHHFCDRFAVNPAEIAFVFDDVLDFAVAAECGLRFMVPRSCNPLLLDFAVRQGLVDYFPGADGGNHAIREMTELLMGLSELYDLTISERMHVGDRYRRYLALRDQPEPLFFTSESPLEITELQPS
jgi:3-deoxy-D-manno-octulosonate 8-phosphate phosphatase (KDO 8-P phosphatase)